MPPEWNHCCTLRFRLSGEGGASTLPPILGCGQEFTATSLPVGEDKWTGERHWWNVLAGCLAPEILAWLLEDPAFLPGSAIWLSMNVCFSGRGTCDFAQMPLALGSIVRALGMGHSTGARPAAVSSRPSRWHLRYQLEIPDSAPPSRGVWHHLAGKPSRLSRGASSSSQAGSWMRAALEACAG